MKAVTYMVSLAIALSLACPSYAAPVEECNEIEVKVTIGTSAADGLNSVDLEVIKGNKSKMKFILCDEKGKVLNPKDLGKTTFSKLRKGNYFALVTDGACTKKVNFTIE